VGPDVRDSNAHATLIIKIKTLLHQYVAECYTGLMPCVAVGCSHLLQNSVQ